ncbi:MAG: Coenzyme F420 hydrogenase/dehydrogenase, beta subunit C-terminal domain [Halanaerobiales bacterium]
MNFNNLKTKVLDKDLCCGCGTCIGICPTNCIDIYPDINQNPVMLNQQDCNECGLCYNVCPGKGFDFPRDKEVSKNIKFDHNLGYYDKFYTGYSLDKNIRNESASGGVATSMIKYLIENKHVEKAIIVSMDSGKPVLKIIDKSEDALQGMQSKYGFIPLNKMIKKINKKEESYVLVGLPCHFQGIENASEYLPNLKKNIKFKIGLLCGYTQTYDSIDYMKKCLNLNPKEDYTYLGWREDAYPGNMAFKNKETGQIIYKPLYEWLAICVPFFTMNRCFLCVDGANELADIVLGDVHSLGDEENCIISRNSFATKVLQDAKINGYISLSEIEYKRAMEYPIGKITTSKRFVPLIVIENLKRNGKPIPNYNISSDYNKSGIKIFAIMKFKLFKFVRSNHIKSKILKHPILAEKVGDFCYRFPNSLIGFPFLKRLYKLMLGR